MADGNRNHGQLTKSVNPPRCQRSNDGNGSVAVANGDVQLSDRGNQGQQTQEQFPRQLDERGDDREEFALETGQDAVLFDNPHGLDADRETVLSVVSLLSRLGSGDDAFHTKSRTTNRCKGSCGLT